MDAGGSRSREVRLEVGETKNGEGRILPLCGELVETLTAQKQLRDQRWPACAFVFSRQGEPIKDFRGAWEAAATKCGMVDERGRPSRLFHDLRRSGVRNLVRSGVPERVAMMISGHRSRSVFDRYNIVSTDDLHQAMAKVEQYLGKGGRRRPRQTLRQTTVKQARERKRAARRAARKCLINCGAERGT